MRKTIMALLAAAGTAMAADVASVNGVNYESLPAAMAAATAGDTVTLLADTALTAEFRIDKPVILDLDGHRLSQSANYLAMCPDGDGAVIQNGTFAASDVCVYGWAGEQTLYATNMTFTGVCTLYSLGGGLELGEGCVSLTRFTGSASGAGGAIKVRGNAVVAPGQSIFDRSGARQTVTFYGGYCTVSPEAYVATGYVCEAMDVTVSGVACHYAVRAPDNGVAMVISPDESVTNMYASVDEAIDACVAGGTVMMLKDMDLIQMLNMKNGVTFDLGGHKLTKATAGAPIYIPENVGDVTIENGEIECPAGIFGTEANSGLLTLSHLTLRGECLISGLSGTLNYCDSVCVTEYLVSSGSKININLLSGAVALSRQLCEGFLAPHSTIRVYGGRFNFDTTEYLVPDVTQILEDYVLDEVQFRYRVLPTAEAGTQNAVRMVSQDGSATNEYASLDLALNASAGGETIFLLKSITLPGKLSVQHNVDFELNGLKLANAAGDFIQPATGVTVGFRNGRIHSNGSIFLLNLPNTTANVTNCILTGLCPLFGVETGVLNLCDCWMCNMGLFGSSNGSAQMHIYGGWYVFEKWRDGNLATGTRFNVHSGRFLTNPATAESGVAVVAEDSVTVYEPAQYSGREYNYHVVPADEVADVAFEAEALGVLYDTVNTVFAIRNGVVVKLLRDVSRQVGTTARRAYVLDLGGHTLSCAGDMMIVREQSALTITNGVLRELNENASCFAVYDGAKLHLSPGVRVEAANNVKACGFFVPGVNAEITIDGADVNVPRLYSWSASARGTLFRIVGEGHYQIGDFPFAAANECPATSSFQVCGGWWSLDPANHIPANYVKFYYPDVDIFKWYVKPWADVEENGWCHDFDSDVAPVLTGRIDGGEVTVKLAGYIPSRYTKVADFSGVIATSPLTFVKDTSLPYAVELAFENGILYARQFRGTIFVVR